MADTSKQKELGSEQENKGQGTQIKETRPESCKAQEGPQQSQTRTGEEKARAQKGRFQKASQSRQAQQGIGRSQASQAGKSRKACAEESCCEDKDEASRNEAITRKAEGKGAGPCRQNQAGRGGSGRQASTRDRYATPSSGAGTAFSSGPRGRSPEKTVFVQ